MNVTFKTVAPSDQGPVMSQGSCRIYIHTTLAVSVVACVTCFATPPSTSFLPSGPAIGRFSHPRIITLPEIGRLQGGAMMAKATDSLSDVALKDAMEKAIIAVSTATVAARAVLATLSNTMEEGTVGKADASPVTVGDFAVQAIVCKTISDAFPEDGIIAEENADVLRKASSSDLLAKVVSAVDAALPGASGADVCDWIDRGTLREHRSRYWTLDPIDGTKGFLRREQFAICLALVVEGNPVASAMACPNLPLSLQTPSASPPGTLFSARKGGGAWMAPLPPQSDGAAAQAAPQRLSLQPKEEPSLRFCESVEAGHSDHETAAQIAATLKVEAPPLRLDSQVKYGVIARGDAEIYLRLPNKIKQKDTVIDAEYVENIWDHAAGTVLIREAGGVVTDMHGQPLDFGHGAKLIKNKGVVASYTPALHAKVIAAVQEHTSFSSPAGWGQGGGHEL